MEYVYLECVKDQSKLRVRIISPGYNPVANCQFPRNLRVVGRKFKVPREYINFSAGSAGTFYYKVMKKTEIEIVEKEELQDAKAFLKNLKIFVVDEDCVICLGEPPDIVLIPCGHQCLCAECNVDLKNRKCPHCMTRIDSVVNTDEIK